MPDALDAAALRLVFVTPGDRPAGATAPLVELALSGGATAVLLREPQLQAGEREDLARRVGQACRALGCLLLVHRDAGLALAVGGPAVHTGFGGQSVAELRRHGLLVGRSAHWPLTDEDAQADYLLLSPFRPTSKSHPRPLLTRAQVDAVLARDELGPVVALGGLTVADVPELPDGLAGVAVMRAIADASDPRAAAAELRQAVERRPLV